MKKHHLIFKFSVCILCMAFSTVGQSKTLVEQCLGYLIYLENGQYTAVDSTGAVAFTDSQIMVGTNGADYFGRGNQFYPGVLMYIGLGGDDILDVSAKVICGGPGNDYITAFGGSNKSLSGGDGDDVIIVNQTQTVFANGNGGQDFISCQDVDYGKCVGGSGNDYIQFLPGGVGNFANGNAGDDYLLADPNYSVKMSGGKNDDCLIIGYTSSNNGVINDLLGNLGQDYIKFGRNDTAIVNENPSCHIPKPSYPPAPIGLPTAGTPCPPSVLATIQGQAFCNIASSSAPVIEPVAEEPVSPEANALEAVSVIDNQDVIIETLLRYIEANIAREDFVQLAQSLNLQIDPIEGHLPSPALYVKDPVEEDATINSEAIITDEIDSNLPGSLDLIAVTVSEVDGELYLNIQTRESLTSSEHWAIYICTEGNALALPDCQASVYVENGTAFSYGGTGSDWAWDELPATDISTVNNSYINNKDINVRLNLADLGLTNVDIYGFNVVTMDSNWDIRDEVLFLDD